MLAASPRGRAATLIGALAVLLGAAPASQAAPGDDATIEATSFTLSGIAQDDAVATCPAGTRATGGGVGTTAAMPSSEVNASGPLDATATTAMTNDGDVAVSWYAHVGQFSGMNTYTVFAICSPSSDATIESSAPFTVSGSSDGDATATCPAGTRATGGGIGSTATTPTSFVEVSGPQDDTGTTGGTDSGDVAASWYASALNSSGSNTYKVFAICSAGADAVIEAGVPFTLTGGSQQQAAVAACPAGTRTTGGGIGATVPKPYAGLQVSGPQDETGSTGGTGSGDVGTSWFASVVNGGGAHTFRVFAICAPNSPGADNIAPETEITKTPKNKTQKRKAKFEFSSEPSATFECSLDGEAFTPCASPLTERVKRGKHEFDVRAKDAAGNADATPAEDRWKVKKKK